MVEPPDQDQAQAPQLIELDQRALELARAASATPWYATGAAGIVLVITAPLFWIYGHLAGQGLSLWADALAFFGLFFGPPCLFFPWLALFFLHRQRVQPLRAAIAQRRAWRMRGRVKPAGRKAVGIGGMRLTTIHAVHIPMTAGSMTCDVIFADARIANPRAAAGDGVVLSLTGPDGAFLYPRLGALPSLLRLPAIVVSAVAALAFTATCNGQAQGYDEAVTRLHEIQAAVPCTGANQPGDACLRWVDGTVEYTGSSSVDAGAGSACSAQLRWPGGRQDGDIRTSLGDCTQLLSSTPAPAKIALVRNYATEVYVGQTLFQTDLWPQAAWPVLPLAVFFRIAAFLWLAWPIAQAGLALFLWLRARSTRRAGTPSPRAPGLGSAA